MVVHHPKDAFFANVFSLGKKVFFLLFFFSSLCASFGAKSDDDYTINYNNVSMEEYVRFVSKITDVNFIFQEEDLQIPVTVVSEDPVSKENVMSILTQLLRIHGLSLLEQDGNLVIHKNPDVKQFAHLVFDGEKIDANYPLVTKLFAIKNEKAESIAAIIRPMISQDAILDISTGTNQLIITDVTANVEKISHLIENLDSPTSPISVESYHVKNNEPDFLIGIANQIIAPLSKGNPFILVAQPKAELIFIVSTPALIDKAVSILRNLDAPPTGNGTAKELKPDNVFIYKTKYHTPSEIERSLQRMAKNMEKSGYIETSFLQTIESAKVIDETNSLLFIGDAKSLNKIREILEILDSPSKEELEEMKDSFYIYKPINRTPKNLKDAVEDLVDNLQDSKMGNETLMDTLKSVQVISSTQSLVFSGDPTSFNKLKEILASLDVPGKYPAAGKATFYLYQLKNLPPDEMKDVLLDVAKNLDKSGVREKGLIEAIRSMKYIEGSNSVLFTGDERSLKRLEEMLPSFDQEILNTKIQQKKLAANSQFYVYKPKYLTGEEIEDGLDDYLNSFEDAELTDKALLQTIKSANYVKSTNSLIFTGNPKSLDKLEGILGTIDVATSPDNKSSFYLYQLQFVTKDQLTGYLQQVARNLNQKETKQHNLYLAIKSMKWIDESHSYMFSGNQESLDKIASMLKEFDTKDQKRAPEQATFLMYELKHVSKQQMNGFLKEVAGNLKGSDIGEASLIDAINSRKWIPQSQAYMFSGPNDALSKLSNLLKNFDVESETRKTPGYFVYHLKHATGDVVEDRLEQFANKMRSSGVKDIGLLQVIDNIKYIKDTNSLLLTGPEQSIEEVKELITQYDVGKPISVASDFFMYKPQYVPAPVIEEQLTDIGSNLRKGGLADEALLTAIKSMKFSDQSKALIFTGTPDALQKVEGLIKEIDTPDSAAGIGKLGKTTFLLYKLKFASGPKITKSLEGIASDLKKSKSDPAFLKALNSMRYIEETNSLLFTGTEPALAKIKKLVEKFDIPAEEGVAEGPSTYFVYKPVYVAGPELETLLTEFVDHLSSTGITDVGLFRAVKSAKWEPKTNSLIFTGTEDSIAKIKELLKTFDIPGGGEGFPDIIQDMDAASFLVYKLQYHKGSEIQAALKQIGEDLLQNKSTLNENLLHAIQSIQWIKVTNSLLCTGDQQTLTRLKELVKNLDVPLKQVFIEILVIETSLSNLLDIGLDWGSKFKVKDKFAGNVSNFSTGTTGTTTSRGDTNFTNGFNSVNASRFPLPTDISLSAGLDLGIIGDIIWHKGRSFASLTSLLRALEQDAETSIVLTPKILTQDNKTSTVFIGQNIPFIGSFVSNQNTNTVQTSNLEYRDIGVGLTLTPVLGNSDIVSLDIQLDNSTVSTDASGQVVDVSVGGVQGITTNKATMETTVHVPNNSFLVLSGNVDIVRQRRREGIPCLGGLPVIGSAFSLLDTSDNRNNLVIFIKPHIINSYEDMKHITQSQEDLFREQTGSGRLEQDFDEAMELIKSFEDE